MAQPPAPAGGIGPVEVPVPTVRLETHPVAIDPGRVLRRALVGWGLGHLSLGDRRGWPLLGLEAVWLATFGLSLALLPTDRWLLCYALLAGFIVAWIAQAVAAYREARARSGINTGAAWLLAVAPFVIALLTGFWLFSGAQASPASTFQHYVGAWRDDDPGAAVGLFAKPPDRSSLEAQWELDEQAVADRVEAIAKADPDYGLDEENPDSNLRFELHDPQNTDAGGPVLFDVLVVRQVTVPTTFFGLVPASRTETRTVDTIGEATLIRRPLDGALAGTGASVWLIDSVRFSDVP